MSTPYTWTSRLRKTRPICSRGRTIRWSGEYLDVEVHLADTSYVPGNDGLDPVAITVRGTSTADSSTMGTSEAASYSVAEEPTWPVFYLPFQDITTNNHIAQWTEIVVDIQ